MTEGLVEPVSTDWRTEVVKTLTMVDTSPLESVENEVDVDVSRSVVLEKVKGVVEDDDAVPAVDTKSV